MKIKIPSGKLKHKINCREGSWFHAIRPQHYYKCGSTVGAAAAAALCSERGVKSLILAFANRDLGGQTFVFWGYFQVTLTF